MLYGNDKYCSRWNDKLYELYGDTLQSDIVRRENVLTLKVFDAIPFMANWLGTTFRAFYVSWDQEFKQAKQFSCLLHSSTGNA